MSKFYCGVCESEIKVSGWSIECCECRTWYHRGCSALSNKEFNEICAKVKKNKQNNWVCPSCKQPEVGGRRSIGATVSSQSPSYQACQKQEHLASLLGSVSVAGVEQQIGDLLKKRTVDNKDVLSVMSKMFKESNTEQKNGVTRFLEEFRDFRSDVTDKIVRLEEKVRKLETEIENIKQKGKHLEASQDGSISLNLEQSDQINILSEIQDRASRANNVILYNVEECSSEEVATRVAHDRKQVQSFLQQLTVDGGDYKVIRLGKNNLGRSRPVKVIFSTSDIATKCLKNKKKLPANIFLSADLTMAQRKQYKKCREEFETRKKNGENNIAMRYMRGTVKIVSTNPRTKN